MSPSREHIPFHVVAPDDLEIFTQTQPVITQNWVRRSGFSAQLGEMLCIRSEDGRLVAILFGWGTEAARARGRFHIARCLSSLPDGAYEICADNVGMDMPTEALGVLLGGYKFTRYKDDTPRDIRLHWPDSVDMARVERIAAAAGLARDLINTPACDMGPAELEAATAKLASDHDAIFSVITGDAALREANLPLIATVGAAASETRAPRLLDLQWGRADAPKVTLVGKGVCFDTGGLNIKPGASMGLMKKDMGGAAQALALAQLIMSSELDLRLRLLIPAVENAISGAAMRPGDIYVSRAGHSVEINNTDAEGRLVLADALALADEENPSLVVSLATLTGAARVALGPELVPFFTDDETLAADVARQAVEVADPMWRMPFWAPYETMIEPDIADLDNAPGGGQAGAITAALFLRRFVQRAGAYLHADLYGWTPIAKPGRPKGGECQAVRALFSVLEARY